MNGSLRMSEDEVTSYQDTRWRTADGYWMEGWRRQRANWYWHGVISPKRGLTTTMIDSTVHAQWRWPPKTHQTARHAEVEVTFCHVDDGPRTERYCTSSCYRLNASLTYLHVCLAGTSQSTRLFVTRTVTRLARQYETHDAEFTLTLYTLYIKSRPKCSWNHNSVSVWQ